MLSRVQEIFGGEAVSVNNEISAGRVAESSGGCGVCAGLSTGSSLDATAAGVVVGAGGYASPHGSTSRSRTARPG